MLEKLNYILKYRYIHGLIYAVVGVCLCMSCTHACALSWNLQLSGISSWVWNDHHLREIMYQPNWSHTTGDKPYMQHLHLSPRYWIWSPFLLNILVQTYQDLYPSLSLSGYALRNSRKPPLIHTERPSLCFSMKIRPRETFCWVFWLNTMKTWSIILQQKLVCRMWT